MDQGRDRGMDRGSRNGSRNGEETDSGLKKSADLASVSKKINLFKKRKVVG